MNVHDFTNALAESIPFIPLTAIIWIQNPDNLFKAISAIPPIFAVTRALTKSRPKVRVNRLDLVEFQKAGRIGVSVTAVIECIGRPVISNVQVRLSLSPPVAERYFELLDFGDEKVITNETSTNPEQPFRRMNLETPYSEFHMADIPKMRKGDIFLLMYPKGSGDSYEKKQGPRSGSFSTNRYLAFQSRDYTLRVVVQGEDSQGNTYEMRKVSKIVYAAPQPKADDSKPKS